MRCCSGWLRECQQFRSGNKTTLPKFGLVVTETEAGAADMVEAGAAVDMAGAVTNTTETQ